MNPLPAPVHRRCRRIGSRAFYTLSLQTRRFASMSVVARSARNSFVYCVTGSALAFGMSHSTAALIRSMHALTKPTVRIYMFLIVRSLCLVGGVLEAFALTWRCWRRSVYWDVMMHFFFSLLSRLFSSKLLTCVCVCRFEDQASFIRY